MVSGTGLNLDPNNSTKLIQEFNIINLKISSEELKNFETCTPKLTTIPVADKFSMTETKVTISSFMILKQTCLEKAQKYVNLSGWSIRFALFQQLYIAIEGCRDSCYKGKWFKCLNSQRHQDPVQRQSNGQNCVTWKVTRKFSNLLRDNCQECEKR